VTVRRGIANRKNIKLIAVICVRTSSITFNNKLYFFGQGTALEPTGGAYDTHPDPQTP